MQGFVLGAVNIDQDFANLSMCKRSTASAANAKSTVRERVFRPIAIYIHSSTVEYDTPNKFHSER